MRLVLIVLLCVVVQFGDRANAAGFPTGFQFSGTLLTGVKPAKGSYDFEFLAYRAPVGGDAVGTTATLDAVKLKKGAYSGQLDFGPGVFTGEPVWIEVRYRKLGKVPVPFETSPDRIAVGATPHAMAADYATTATHAASSDFATTATFADSAAFATSADYATTASFAALANYADSSGDAATATYASGAGQAATAATAETLQGLPPAAFLNMAADAYVVVQTTASATQNGANLLAAYAAAKTLTPNGAALSATNRAAVLVAPASYDLGTGQLVMDTEFVDVIGLSTNRENQYIFSLSNGSNTGVLRQTANDVRIENLKVHCSRTGPLNLTPSHPAAYFPDSNEPQTSITNCAFSSANGAWSMRVAIVYSGRYTECTGEIYAFGRDGTASGTFTNCTGGNWSFGGNGTASGTFTNCTGGGNAFGGWGLASGTFTNCTGGGNAFGGNGTASGTFTNCTGGDVAFGGNGDATNGRFYYCRGGVSSFGPGYTARLFCIQGNSPL